ncbi:GPI biosynthesis protein family Pig-F-domain-containing protein [Aspergillus bertholletiae]|uniref:GPI biosynthesis protein family Pig-F-domain-containing protein n=1 Tax=Aspergillus bertholletiae TaxID=1226010 RepID=A0A5N7BDC8_9EURO|nr:GPI biosynthesis protein family Pig-F-domain-containing protein [Aspergillus bertholletiae]
MSTTPPSSPSLSQGPAAPKFAPPIHILPNSISKTYALIHPVVLLALLAFRFNALVADPVAELLGNLPFLALLQVAFVMTCLPPAGSAKDDDDKSTSAAILKPGKIGLRRKNTAKSDSGGLSTKLIPAILSLTLTTLLATPVLAILLVLFGAPLTTHHAETLLCAAHMALLTSTALIYVHGVDGSVWKEVWGAQRPADAVWGAALGTCVGAWFGAVPIPLDWDRPWQAFPITILVGAYIGYSVGFGLGRTVLFGKRLRIEENGELAEGKKAD